MKPLAYEVRRQVRGAMKKCPVCGREFWCYDVLQWAYRSRNGAGTPVGWICSWSCQAKHNRENAKPVELGLGDEMNGVLKRRRRKGDAEPVRYIILSGLRGMLEQKKITRTELARRVGITVGVTASYASMQSRCPEDRAKLIAEVLGCTVSDLTAPKNGEGTSS